MIEVCGDILAHGFSGEHPRIMQPAAKELSSERDGEGEREKETVIPLRHWNKLHVIITNHHLSELKCTNNLFLFGA